MRVKPVPRAPADLEGVAAAHRAIPLVPEPEGACWRRIADRLDLAGRDEARTWLTFLRGLGLVVEGSRGFSRVRRDLDRGALAAALRDGVFGAREAADALGEDPQSVEAVFEALEQGVPAWERAKYPGAWREQWRARTRRLLDWLVLAGLAEREGEDEGEGYVAAGTARD